jgi:hypothetical protein
LTGQLAFRQSSRPPVTALCCRNSIDWFAIAKSAAVRQRCNNVPTTMSKNTWSHPKSIVCVPSRFRLWPPEGVRNFGVRFPKAGSLTSDMNLPEGQMLEDLARSEPSSCPLTPTFANVAPKMECECRRRTTSTADLKSLTHSRQNRIQGLQIVSGTRIISLVVPMTFRSS